MRLVGVVRVEREEPALPVLLEVDGRLVEAWVQQPDRSWRAQVTWSEVRDYGFEGRRVDVVPRSRLRPRS